MTIKRKRGRPLQRKELNIPEVLNIAVDVFAEKGYDGAQMQEIAARTGIANSSLNYHFGGKEELWKQAVMQVAKKFLDRMEELEGYFKDLNGIAKLKAFNRQYIYFSAANPQFYKIVFHQMCAQTERSKWFVHHILKPIFQYSEDMLLDQKVDAELLKQVPVANLTTIAIGAANTFFMHAFQMKEQYGIDPFQKEEIEKHADIVLDVFFARYDK